MRCLSIKYWVRLFVLVIFCVGLFWMEVLTPWSSSPRILCASSDDIVVATVNNEPISKSTLDLLVKQYKGNTNKDNVTIDEKKQIIKSLMTRYLILQQSSVQALKNDEDIIAKVMVYENNLIVNRFVKDQVDKKVTVTDKELRKYYNLNTHEFRTNPKVQARAILLKTKEQAEKVLYRLRKGEDFGKLAQDFSIDPFTASDGGSMAILEKGKGKVFTQIEEVLFDLKPGEISDVVETAFGFNILSVDEVFPSELKPFEEVREQIKRSILQQKKAQAFEEMSNRLQRDAEIKIFENRLLED
ncbi:MAG: peptidyl-prolyl cis-trans isomerase [Deltaproteobacteria bacterium]|nr:peptidyl-prolyl cis-trans isomerase [Deltaproteobacteria bacterium]